MTLGAKIGLACALAAVLAALAIWIARRMRATPEKRERLRRLSIHTTGRLGDAFLTAVDENLLHYTYKVRGVQYEASQDVSTLRDYLPADPERMIGMVGMKYLSDKSRQLHPDLRRVERPPRTLSQSRSC